MAYLLSQLSRLVNSKFPGSKFIFTHPVLFCHPLKFLMSSPLDIKIPAASEAYHDHHFHLSHVDVKACPPVFFFFALSTLAIRFQEEKKPPSGALLLCSDLLVLERIWADFSFLISISSNYSQISEFSLVELVYFPYGFHLLFSKFSVL